MASADVGPRFAPEDPTLPKPWKGLIDGVTGNLYYWNPESNVTQYERPPNMEPVVVQPPPVVAPKLAPIPVARSQQPNVDLSQSYQSQGYHQQQQQQPHTQFTPQYSDQQQGQPQAVQPMWQPMPQQSRDQSQLVQQPAQRMPQHIEQQQPWQQQLDVQKQTQTQTTSPFQGQQFSTQQQIDVQKQTSASFQGQQFSSQQQIDVLKQPPSPFQGQQFPTQQQQMPYQVPGTTTTQARQTPGPQGAYQQGQQISFPQREEPEYQRGRETGFSSSMIQQPASSVFQNRSQIGSPSIQPQQHGGDSVHQQHNGARPMFQGQPGSAVTHDPRPGGSPMGLNMGHRDDVRERSGNEFYFNPSLRGSGMVPAQQSKVASVPLPQNQMDLEFPRRVVSGHVNGLSPGMGHIKDLSTGGQPFGLNAVAPLAKHGPADGLNMSAAEIYRRDHEITATGDNVPDPFMTFASTGLPPEILREIQFAGFTSPTPIQAQTWPISLQSRDIVAIAKTGSGKTLGYLVPAFVHLRQCRPSSQIGPKVLVLAPTRELATQIHDEAVKFGRSSGISCTCLYGGAPKGPQIRELDRGVDIVVATPGRLNDILEMRKIDFRQVSFLVLDEADRMLDMGFEPQIRKIVDEIPPRRQTLMYTATWPKEVRKIAGDLLVHPVQVNIGRVDELAANKAITQYVEVVSQFDKQRRLEEILRSQERGSKVIIFCSTKRLCDQLTRNIGRPFGAAAIHGDKSQGERDHVLNQFRSGKSPILVATDVAARGLDVKDIRMVINYDFPTGIEDYVHRIGRTGRAGATGVAHTFFSDQDRKHAGDLIKVLEGANQAVPPQLQEMASSGRPSFMKGHSGMSRGDYGGGRGDYGGGRGDYGGGGGRGDYGGGRGDFGGGRGGMRDGGSFGGRGGMRDGGSFGGRGGHRDDSFGGRQGRNDFGGRGNRGRGGFSGSGRGFGGHDNERYNNDARGQYNSRRGISDGARGRSFGRRNASPEMVSTWDTRSSSSSRSRSRSSRSSRSRSRSRSLPRRRNRSRIRSRSPDRFRVSRDRTSDQDPIRSERLDRRESKFSSLPSGPEPGASPGVSFPSNPPLVENPVSGGSLDGATQSLQQAANVEDVPT